MRPKQSLGQNFLSDENIARNIVREMHLDPDDIVIEIGPGHGALTKHIAGKVRYLAAYEIDKRIVGELQEKYQSAKVSIIHGNFLEAQLSDWKKKFRSKVRVVGNIPYHLTSPILFKMFDERNAVSDVTIMMQREVAKRITATPNTKDYGILAVFSQFYGTVKSLFEVSPNCFYPKPKVTSTVVRVLLHNTTPDDFNDVHFRSLVKTAFGKRRKTLRNSLAYLPFDEDILKLFFETVEFDFSKRPEQISIEQFVRLSMQIEKIQRWQKN